MASPGFNPHKKGEHVFNDIAGSLENALTCSLKADTVKSIALVGRYSELRLGDLPKTTSYLDRVKQDRILIQARTVVAPATGLHNDPNSKTYGAARKKLEYALAGIVVTTGLIIWKKKPSPASSFREFDVLVTTLKDLSTLKTDANAAIDSLVVSGYDPQAEAGALAELVSNTELARRQAAIASLKQHWPILKQTCHSIVTSFCDEVETILQKRIAEA